MSKMKRYIDQHYDLIHDFTWKYYPNSDKIELVFKNEVEPPSESNVAPPSVAIQGKRELRIFSFGLYDDVNRRTTYANDYTFIAHFYWKK